MQLAWVVKVMYDLWEKLHIEILLGIPLPVSPPILV